MYGWWYQPLLPSEEAGGGTATFTATLSLDALLQKTVVKTVSLDALLERTGNLKTTSLDAVVAKTFTKTVNLDALLEQSGELKTTSLDGLLFKSGNLKTTSLDGLLSQTETKVVSLDAVLETSSGTATITKTASLDGLLFQSGETKTTSFDGLLFKSGITKTTSLDAELFRSATKTLNLDALLQQTGETKTVSLDGLLLQTELKTVSLDAVVSTGVDTPVANNWQSTGANSGTTLTLSNYIVSAGSNLVLVVGTAAKDTGTGGDDATLPTGITWNSVALTKIVDIACVQEGGQESGASLWGLVNPTPGTGDVVVTWSEDMAGGVHVFATYLTGAAQVLPTTYVNSSASTTDANTHSISITSVPAGSLCIDSSAHSGPTTGTYSVTGTGQVERVNDSRSSGGSRGLGSETPTENGGDTTMGWSVTTGNWGRRATVIAAFGAPAATATVSLDGLLQKTGNLKTVSLDGNIVLTTAPTINLDALLNATDTKQVNLDARLIPAGSEELEEHSATVSLDAHLAPRTNSLTTDFDAFLFEWRTEEETASGVWTQATAPTNPWVGTSLATRGFWAAPEGQAVPGTVARFLQASLDAVLIKTQPIEVSLDAELAKAASLKTVSLGALLQATGETKTTSFDGLLQATGEVKTTSLDAHIVDASAQIRAVPMDGLLFQSGELKTTSMDGLLFQSGELKTVSLDALAFQSAEVKTVSLDGLLQATGETKTVSMDGLLLATGEAKTVSLDAELKKSSSAVLSLDALLSQTETKTVSMDAELISSPGFDNDYSSAFDSDF